MGYPKVLLLRKKEIQRQTFTLEPPEEMNGSEAPQIEAGDACPHCKAQTRAAESHLRAHIIPKLGSLHLIEVTTKAVQRFVADLAGGERSRKTAENVLLTLSSLLKTARAWGYACGDFRFADLTLPREGVKKEPRCFTDDEVRKIITKASEPLGTIVAVTAVLGLRIGETLALRKSDVDFAKHVIRIRQSVDAATRTVGAVKSKASSAEPMRKTVLSEQTARKTIASAVG